MGDSNHKIIQEDFMREFNNVGIQINLAKPDSVDLLQLIREREDLKKKLEDKEKEINSLQAKQYDFMDKIEKLQKENSKQNVTAVQKSPGLAAPTQTRGRRASIATTNVNHKPILHEVEKKTILKQEKPEPVIPKPLHPKIPNMEGLQSDTLSFYKEIGARLPDLKLSTVLEAETKFQKADGNGDGVIDVSELDVFLSSYNLLLTKNQLENILREIDTDDTKTIDFFEALKIVDRLWTNKPTKLPDDIRRNRTNVCNIQ